MVIDARHLEVFLAVCRHGSLGRAANALNLTQPAVSKSVRRLEGYLDAPLFERGPRGMVPTPYGTALRQHAELISSEVERAVDEIRALKGGSRGRIAVGASPSVASGVLRRAVAALLGKSPELRIEVREGIEGALLEALLGGEIDLAVAGGMRRLREYPVRAEVLFADDVVIVCRTGHPLTRRRRLRLADTLAFPWVLPDRDNVMWRRLAEAFDAEGLEPPASAVVTGSAAFMKALVADTDSLTYLPRALIREEERHGSLRPLSPRLAVWQRQVVAMRRRQGSLPSATLALLEELRRASTAIMRATAPLHSPGDAA